MNTELVIILALASVCMLVGLTSSVLYIVAGFRASIGWGIVNLLPLGSLVFTICRWDLAKGPFLLSLVSGILAFGTFSVAGARLNDGVPFSAERLQQFVKSVSSLDSPGSSDLGGDSQDDLIRLRDQEVLLEEQIGMTTAELKVAYADLLAKRKDLPSEDQEAVRQFNQEAAAYSERNRQLAESRVEQTRLRQSIREELDERAVSEGGKAAAVKPAPQVTVYSTSWCGPCKMAKAHLKKRGVAFKEIDVEKSPEGAAEFRKLGGGGVPLIVINGEKIRGFNAQRIDALLGQS